MSEYNGTRGHGELMPVFQDGTLWDHLPIRPLDALGRRSDLAPQVAHIVGDECSGRENNSQRCSLDEGLRRAQSPVALISRSLRLQKG